MKVGNHYITLTNSPFVSRQGKKDCVISVKGNWGVRKKDGYYHSVIRLAFESGEILRQYEPFPSEITLELLKNWGFLLDN
jgi:hypothetical protein